MLIHGARVVDPSRSSTPTSTSSSRTALDRAASTRSIKASRKERRDDRCHGARRHTRLHRPAHASARAGAGAQGDDRHRHARRGRRRLHGRLRDGQHAAAERRARGDGDDASPRRRATAACRVYPIGAVSKGLKGEELAELADLRAAGCVGVSDDGKPVWNAQLMRRALEYCSMLGMPVIAHEEDANLIEGGVMHEGYFSTLLGMRGIPAASEETLVARDVILARLTNAHVHIAHLSTAGAVDAVRRARAEGVKVTCEVTPHHIALGDDAVQSFSTNLKMNPPLRSEAHRAGAPGGHRRRDDRRHRHRSRAASLRREERRVRPGAVRRDRPGDGVRGLLRPPRARESDRPRAPHRAVLVRSGAHLRPAGRHAAEGERSATSRCSTSARATSFASSSPRPRTRRSSARPCTDGP